MFIFSESGDDESGWRSRRSISHVASEVKKSQEKATRSEQRKLFVQVNCLYKPTLVYRQQKK